ncbi:MAG: DUF4190 domain-containing protein, partial [Chloroflexota bacterium]
AALICRHCGAQVTPAGWQPGPTVSAPSGVATAPGAPVHGLGIAPPRRSTNGMAIASMVLGIVWVCGIGSILALIFGYIARRQIRDSMGAQGGDGMAIAGIVLGWIGVATFAVFLVVGIVNSGNSDVMLVRP